MVIVIIISRPVTVTVFVGIDHHMKKYNSTIIALKKYSYNTQQYNTIKQQYNINAQRVILILTYILILIITK